MGILQKKPNSFWAFPSILPSYPFLLSSPGDIWFLSWKNVFDLPIRKNTIGEEIWNILQLYSSGIVLSLTPSFLSSPDEILSLSWKNVLDLPIRKSTIGEEIWNILQLYSSSIVFWVKLQNILNVVLWWAVSKIMHTCSHVYTTYIKLHHYNIITLWTIITSQNCTI